MKFKHYIEEDKQKKEYETLKFDELNEVLRKQEENNNIQKETINKSVENSLIELAEMKKEFEIIKQFIPTKSLKIKLSNISKT